MKGINNGNIVKLQEGVIRTNCVDCLDRTNVVQSMIGRAILHKQLGNIINKATSDPLASFPSPLEFCFRSFWTNNADALSKMYTGTPAQKTDFTRTGKRSNKGMIKDLQYGLQRYYINNFMDGTRKNIIDIFLGKIRPSILKPKNKFLHFATALVGFIVMIICCNAIASKTGEGVTYYIILVLSFLFTLQILKMFGHKLVENPIII